MRLYSTAGQASDVNFKEAIFRGLPPDNGLYMPRSIPQLSQHFFDHIEQMSLKEMAREVTVALLGDEIPEKDISELIEDVINFEAPLVEVEPHVYALELFHGPSNAFKDFGARFMSRFMGHYLRQDETFIHILVATSGDTGGAVAMGFYDTPGIEVTILYPKGKVSLLQEKQLTTLGKNIRAIEVDGTFDDCQKLVKTAFLDQELSKKLHLSSANSINIARLIPQSFYYFSAYAQLKKEGLPVSFCTPSGNFGNLCGGLIAQKMGLPVDQFVAATNANDVVPQYIASGIFEPRPSIRTMSNAMDVGNPSNFVRLKALFNNDLERIRQHIKGYAFTDEETQVGIRTLFNKNYIACPHTAIGYLGIQRLKAASDHPFNGVFLGTAHPAKFVNELDHDISEKVVLPKSLEDVKDKQKVAHAMDTQFESLKSYLLAVSQSE